LVEKLGQYFLPGDLISEANQ